MYTLTSFVVSVVFHYIFFNMVKYGYLGSVLQLKFLEKINNNDFKWLNHILILTMILSIIIDNSIIPIYCDDPIFEIKMNDNVISFKGEYVHFIMENQGPTAAFVAGAKIASKMIVGSKLSLPMKIAIPIGSGSASAFSVNMVNNLNEGLKARLLAKQISDHNVELEINEVALTNKNVVRSNIIDI